MAQLRINPRSWMPARVEYPASHDLMNWFWNDFDHAFSSEAEPLSNIVETNTDFRIELSIPGFSKNDIKIKLDGQYLNISGEVENSDEKKEENFVRHEFSRQSFSRSFRLSNWVDSGNITAKYENGVLQLNVPKVDAAKTNPAKQIEIE